MKVIVAGGRCFKPTVYHENWLKNKLKELHATEVVSGDCLGADHFGERIAWEMRIPIKQFKPDWRAHGKSAGPIRNALMAQYADACILFPGGTGTLNMKNSAIFHGLSIYEYKE